MAEEISLEVRVKGAQSVGELRGLVKEFTAEAIKAKQAGNEIISNEFLKAAGKAKAELGDLREDIASLDPDKKAQAFARLGTAVVGGFTAATGAVALFAGKNEQVEQSLLKVQGALAVLQGVQSIADAREEIVRARRIIQIGLENGAQSTNIALRYAAIAAQQALNAVTNLSLGPLALISAAVAALAIVYNNVKTNINAAQKAQEEFNKASLQDDKRFKEKIANIDFETQKSLNAAKIRGASEQELTKIEKAGNEEKILAFRRYKSEQVGLTLEQTKEFTSILNKETDLIVKTAQERNAENKKAAEERHRIEEEAAKKRKELLEKERQDGIESEKSRIQGILDLEKQLRDTKTLNIEDDQARAIQQIEDQYNDKINSINTFGPLEIEVAKQLEINKNQSIANINKQFAEKAKAERDKKIKEDIEAELKRRAALVSIGNSLVDGLSAINTIISEKGKEANDVQKALTLVKLGIDTASAISSLTAHSEANPSNSVTYGLAGVAQFAAGIVRILANIAQAKELLSGNSGGSVPSGGGSVPSFASVPQPNQSVFSNNVTFLNNTGGGSQQQQTQQPIIIENIISEQEITDTQSRVSRIKSRAQIG